jgi:4-amino-4-deoxy-L-arabinose transferase-like glycosyltransferase
MPASHQQPRRRSLPGWLHYLLLAVLSLGVSAMTIYRGGLPDPHIHDEFSYLLAADTFALGRLTNPTHPMWKYLQTFYVLQRPSYQSKYPPGQGLVLALGQVITGEPIVGVWIITAALVLAAAWMLAGFVEFPWAIAGAAVLAVHPQIVEWSRIYWGGTIAALGGVMMLGGWARMMRGSPAGRPAVVLGIGLGILLNTRPYEGFAMAVPVIVSLLWRANWKWCGLVLIVFAPIALWTGYYNFRVTGHLFELPYVAYEQQYAAAPPLLIQSPRPVPTGIPIEMQEYARQVELPHFNRQRSLRGFVTSVAQKSCDLLGDIAGAKPGSLWFMLACAMMLALAVPIALAIRRNRGLWIVLTSILCTAAATMISNWTRSQYVAPAVGAVLILVVSAARELAYWSKAAGWLVLMFAIFVFAALSVRSAGNVDQGSGRARIALSLAKEPGRQLVLVRYLPHHRVDDEWVENEADIDHAKTVWARDPGPGQDRDLLDYFRDRTVWRLTVGHDGVSIARANSSAPLHGQP